MNEDLSESRLEQQQRTREGLAAKTDQTGGMEFATPEEMLRHDADATPVPPGLAPRVRESLAREKPPARRWWQRLLGR